MAYYSGFAAEYDFDRFVVEDKSTARATATNDSRSYSRTTASRSGSAGAPDVKTKKPDGERELKTVPNKSIKQRMKEDRITLRRALYFIALAGVLLIGIGSQLKVGAESYRLSRQIASAEVSLEVGKSENIRLQSELNGITGIGKIDEYAEKILGMVKVESYQVECIDLSEDDAVLFVKNGLF